MSYKRPHENRPRSQDDSVPAGNRICPGHSNTNQEGKGSPLEGGKPVRDKHCEVVGQEGDQSVISSTDSCLQQQRKCSGSDTPSYRADSRVHHQDPRSFRYRGRGRARECWVDNQGLAAIDHHRSVRGRRIYSGDIGNQKQNLGSGLPDPGGQAQNYKREVSHQQRQRHDLGNRAPQLGIQRNTRDLDHQEDKKQNPHPVDRPQQNTEQSSGNQLCLYCGHVIENADDVYVHENELYHTECFSVHKPRSEKAVAAFRDISKKGHVLCMALPVKHLYGTKRQEPDKTRKKEFRNVKTELKDAKKKFRDAKITELLDNATALRNSNSGYLLIHLVGLDPEDTFTGAFDEFADAKLQGLINDGSLFDDVYTKTRLSEFKNPKLKEFTDILVLYVERAEFLITSDFKTKLALDECIIDTPDQTLLRFIQKKRQCEEKFPESCANKAEDLCSIRESRHIQTKAYFEPKLQVDKLVLHILERLRGAEYISAFTKNKKGGSFLLGLREIDQEFPEYVSKTLRVTPVAVDDCEVLRQLIQDRISSTCLVCDYDGNVASSEKLVKTFFIPAGNSTSTDDSGYVLHLSVRWVNGIVFYDQKGPVAYKVKEETPQITRLDLSEWFSAFRQRLQDFQDI